MSFWQLFLANFRMLYRNWRGLFFNIFMPIILYVAISRVASGGSGQNTSYSDFLLPGIIAMTIMQTGIYGLAYWLVDLKARGVMKRFMVTPLSTQELVGSLILSRLVLMLIQITILVLIGNVFFDASVRGSLIAIIILLVLGGATFLGIGFFVSSLAKTYEEAAPLTTIMNLVFTFMGNIFFPASVLPKILQTIGGFLPVTYLAQGMRNNFIQPWTLRQSVPDIIGLSVWLVIILALNFMTFKLSEE